MMKGKQGLLQKLRCRGLPKVDVIIDCRMFKSEAFEKVVRHTGNHVDVIKDVVEHPLFKATAREALDMIHEDAKKDKDIVVLSVCTSGCHRSVAMTLILQSILESMSYHVRVRHLSSGSWVPRGLCQHCEACDTNNTLKQAVFKVAFEKIRR